MPLWAAPLGVVFTRRCHSGVSEQCLIHPCPCCRFGEGFAISGGEQWRVRRKAVGPALHRCEFLVAQLICADTRTLQEPKVAAAAAAAAARQLRCTRLLIFAQGLPGGDAGPRVWRVGCPICSLVGAVSCLSIVQGLPGGHAGPCVWRVGAAPQQEAGGSCGIRCAAVCWAWWQHTACAGVSSCSADVVVEGPRARSRTFSAPDPAKVAPLVHAFAMPCSVQFDQTPLPMQARPLTWRPASAS